MSADLPGIVEQIAFDSGKRGAAGRRPRPPRHQPGTRRSSPPPRRRHEPRQTQPRPDARACGPKGITSQAELDRAAAEQRAGRAPGSARSAPPSSARRSGRRSPAWPASAQVNLGQYLQQRRPDRLAAGARPDLRRPSPCPQQEVGRLGTGARGRGDRRGARRARPSSGTITAIDSVVDEATRNIRVQATLANPQQRLRPGHVRRRCSCRSAATTSVDHAPGLRGQLTRRTATRCSSSRR